MLRDIKRRGLSCPRLVVGDGHLGLGSSQRLSAGGRATLLGVNVLAKLPKRQQDQAKLMLPIPYAPTRTDAQDSPGGAATIPTERLLYLAFGVALLFCAHFYGQAVLAFANGYDVGSRNLPYVTLD